MTNMEDVAKDYFASMNHLARKMIEYNESVKEMYRDAWDGLSWEQQEQLIDQHIIDPNIVAKYSSWKRSEEPLNCFPVFKINSGEKVIVDFEHDDGWTWTDEHSAPFSWKTKSQQDLTLADLDDANGAKEEQNKKGRVGKKTRSPDRTMFESSAINGDRSKNEVEKMFEKFGIKVPGGSDDENDGKSEQSVSEVVAKDHDCMVSPSHLYNENSKLLDDSSDAADSKEFLSASSESFSTGRDVEAIRKAASKQNTTAEKINEPKKKTQSGGKKEKGNDEKEKGIKEKTNKKKKKASTSTIQLSEQPCTYFANSEYNDSGMVEKLEGVVLSVTEPAVQEALPSLHFEEIGESSTDYLDGKATMNSSTRTNDVFNFEAPDDDFSTVVTTQPKKTEVSLDFSVMSTSDQIEASSGPIIKTGFDFLDNW